MTMLGRRPNVEQSNSDSSVPQEVNKEDDLPF